MPHVNAFKARPCRECGLLPLPKGEGWGEGLQTIDRSEPPHPNPLPCGERESGRAVIKGRAHQQGSQTMLKRWTTLLSLATISVALGASDALAQTAPNCTTMRKINIGVSVAPPNVVHASPYIAKELGFFAKRCIDASIIQFEGGQSATSNAAAVQGSAIVAVSDVAIGNGMKVQQFWGLAPRMPQAYMVAPDVKTAKDLKGKRLSATGGGVGGFNWRMGREVLKSAGLAVEDAQFIASAMAGRLPGLVAGQVDGVALHPEDVYLAKQQKPTLNILLQLADLMPNYQFNSYGASTEWIARDRALLRDTIAAMIEANRTIYRDRAKVVPIIMKATEKPKEAVEYAIEVETKNCVWSVNTGFDGKRTEWTIDNSIENGDIDKATKPTVEQVANLQFAKEAVEAAGGPVTIGNCKD